MRAERATSASSTQQMHGALIALTAAQPEAALSRNVQVESVAKQWHFYDGLDCRGPSELCTFAMYVFVVLQVVFQIFYVL